MIEIKDYSYRYDQEWVLRNVTATIDRELAVITGKSGSGKSTLALAVAGFLDKGYHEGEILFHGKNIEDFDLFDLAQRIAIVQQDPESQICTMRVEDEIAFGLENLCLHKDEIEKRIDWALSIVNGQYLRKRDTISLSGGEKQKIAIASILALKPEVIIFDEPTSNLDIDTTKEIMQVITKIKRKADVSALVIEHKWKHIYKYADSLYEMDSGNLKKIQKPPEISYIGYRSGTGPPVLTIKDLSFSYDKKILDNLNLTVHEKEIVGIMGPNGSGKTTLLMCIMNFLQYSGDIFLREKSIKKRKTHEIARDIGLIFQNPNHQIFENTVVKEAAFAGKNFGITTDIEYLLRKSDLEKYSHKNPFRLSYGEKRRLNIVSVLSYKPDIVLLDEPFIGQDYDNVQKIMDLLKGSTCVIVLHDPFIAGTFCKRIFVLEGGKLHEAKPTH
ncbi:MAG: ABC transporter ATP-binding protein [Theionarchaea archaeon]|nr:ABC transporter ATP-binding protein [Theionarchaea archaeon]